MGKEKIPFQPKYINLGQSFRMEHGYIGGPIIYMAEHILVNEYEVKRLIEREAKKLARTAQSKSRKEK